jgi:hypothetical protein
LALNADSALIVCSVTSLNLRIDTIFPTVLFAYCADSMCAA